MSDDLSGLAVFVAVAERKSFTAAAAHLGVTPSSVSQTIRALEGRIGVRLLQRTTRSVTLTEAGTRFFKRVGPAVSDLRDAVESLDELRERPAGTLRLNVPRAAWSLLLQPVLADFTAAFPELHLELTLDDGLARIVEEGFDAGIRLGETLDKEMIAVRIGGELRIAVVGSPAYFSRCAPPKHPRELHAHDCIRYRQITRGAIYRWEFTENDKELEIDVDGRLIVNDAEVMVRAALDGLGLAYVFHALVEGEVARGDLVQVLEAYCPPFPGFFLYYPSRRHVPPKLQVLLDFLKRRMPRPK